MDTTDFYIFRTAADARAVATALGNNFTAIYGDIAATATPSAANAGCVIATVCIHLTTVHSNITYFILIIGSTADAGTIITAVGLHFAAIDGNRTTFALISATYTS